MRRSKTASREERAKPWADVLAEELRVAEARAAATRAAAERARTARRTALDAAHQATMAQYGKPFENLFRSRRVRKDR